MANNPKKINVTISEAENRMSQDLRNNIYSALLSGDGIRNIEGTLDRQLAESGFKDELRRYITDLFRSGQATTALEARALAMAKIREQMQGGTDDDDQPNGVNGTNGEEQKYNLKIPTKAVVEGTKTVRKELEKVCEITEDDPEAGVPMSSAPAQSSPVSSGPVKKKKTKANQSKKRKPKRATNA